MVMRNQAFGSFTSASPVLVAEAAVAVEVEDEVVLDEDPVAVVEEVEEEVEVEEELSVLATNVPPVTVLPAVLPEVAPWAAD